MARSVPHPRGTLDDGELARLASSGDGHAFAELYDRHEQRVYGFCMRMLSAPHDAADATQETFVRMLARLPALEGRDLHFVAYTLATARNVCYDMIRARRTVEPVAEQPQPRIPPAGDVELDPERFALLAAAREDVRAANAALPARQREVLALREVELLSYDEIGELMDLNRNAVAQLVSRARIKFGELLRGGALASVSSASPDCARALPLLASIQDGQDCEHPGELDWVHTHLSGCDTCRLNRAAMEEAGASYRALGLLVPMAWLRHATIARAAELVGADWSHVAGPASATNGPTSGQSGSLPQSSESAGQAAGERPSRLARQVARSGAGGWTGRRTAWTERQRARTTRRGLTWTLIAGALLALCVVLVAMVGGTQDGHVSPSPTVVGGEAAHTATTATNSTHKPHHRTAATVAAKHGTPSFERPANTDTTSSVSTAPEPHHFTNRGSTGNHHRHQAPSQHRPAPAKPTPKPPATTTPTTTTPAATTPVTPPPVSPPPVSTPTTTTPPPQTTPEPAPPTTGPSEPTAPGGGLIP